jgi:hypothetical protein
MHLFCSKSDQRPRAGSQEIAKTSVGCPLAQNRSGILKCVALGSPTFALFLLAFLAFLAVLVILHLPYLKLPYFWDEMGQFVPSALDLYRDGAWIARSVPTNVHPPSVMALLALIWRVFGYSILSARLTMLTVASLGLLFSFILTIRLTRGKPGAAAFTAVLFLIATPIFYTQSMLVMLDMPAMTFTILGLLLFFEERYLGCAVVCAVLVLIKETAITTPAVFAAWLWFRQKQRRESFYFALPAVALGMWLLLLHHATGQWLGNEDFARDNVTDALNFHHIFVAVGVRAWFLFVGDGHWIGAVALYVGWHQLRGREWSVAGLVATGQVAIVTLLGGAELDRYLVPTLPILYAAVATAACAYSVKWRWTSHTAMIVLLILGWLWNPPYPYPYEDNLTMVDFIRLQQEAAAYLELYAPDKRIASVWPFTFAVQHPELGYVTRRLKSLDAPGLRIADLAALDRHQFELLVVYKRFSPIKGTWLDVAPLRPILRRLHHYYDVRVQATDEEIRAGLGFIPLIRWARRDQWIVIYAPARP